MRGWEDSLGLGTATSVPGYEVPLFMRECIRFGSQSYVQLIMVEHHKFGGRVVCTIKAGGRSSSPTRFKLPCFFHKL